MAKLHRRDVPETNKPATIAYLRVSTDGQDLEKNRHDILELANAKIWDRFNS